VDFHTIEGKQTVKKVLYDFALIYLSQINMSIEIPTGFTQDLKVGVDF